MELYEEVDNKKKSKLPMIIGISLTVLIILIIVIIGTIIYLKQSVMQITVNGQNKNEIEKLLYIPEDDNTKLYIPIRAIAKYLNYNDFRGDYKIKSEDSTKCYVKNENEIAMFTKDSDTLVKTRGDSDYEYVKLEEKVLEKVIKTVKMCKNGAGVFYWEPGWYQIKGVGVARGKGNEWENQAVFDNNGYALKSIKAFEI